MDAPVEIQKMMGPKETIEIFVDGEAFPEVTIDTLVVTNDRIILKRPRSDASKSDITVYTYPQITGVGLEKGFLRSIIRLRVNAGGEPMDSIRLPSKVAEKTFESIKEKVCGRPGSC